MTSVFGNQPAASNLRTRMRALFEEYFAFFVEAHELALNGTRDDARRLIDLRRRLSNTMGQMSRSVVDVDTVMADTADKRAIAHEHRKLFGAERAAVARHQSKWTAPAMGDDLESYGSDMAILRDMLDRNHRWRMAVLIPALPIAGTGFARS